MSEFIPTKGRVLLSIHGVYKQADVFTYDDYLFAQHGTGYVQLRANGDTSKVKLFWRYLEMVEPYHSEIGKLKIGPDPKAKSRPRAVKDAA